MVSISLNVVRPLAKWYVHYFFFFLLSVLIDDFSATLEDTLCIRDLEVPNAAFALTVKKVLALLISVLGS